MKSHPPRPISASEEQRFTRFRIVREIGKGAQGDVLEAVDLERDARVAIKTLRAVLPDDIARIKNEFRAVRDLRHPSLVRLGELIEEGGRWLFTMELVDGVDLLSYVRAGAPLSVSTSWPAHSITRVERAPGANAPTAADAGAPPSADRPVATFDDVRLRRSLGQIASALLILHRAGKLHRDLKPANVIVEPGGRAVLIDFGVASELTDEDDGQLVGTVPYMAPEQSLGDAVGAAADWYSFGVILFEALTGRRPFEGSASDILGRKCVLDPPRPSDFVREVPPDLESLCVRLIARIPEERATGEEVLRVLGVDEAGAAPLEAPFVGRTRELAALGRAYEKVAHGQGALAVVLEGESGVGKSALARRFVAGLRDGDPRPLVLTGRCHEHERVPYNAFDAVIDALVRHLRTRKPSTRAELLPRRMSRVRTLFPTVGAIEEEHDSDAPGTLDARAVREEAFGALRELLRRVGERWPVVLLLEDLQWADLDSLALLEALTEPPGAPCMLVVATTRRLPGGEVPAAARAMRGEVRRIALEGLGHEDANALVTRLLAHTKGRASIDPEAIIESTHGHPMFVEELVRYLQQPRARGSAVALDDALRARVGELGENARRVLGVIATAGAPTEQGAIAAAARIPFADYADTAAILHEAKLVRVRGARPDDPVEPFHDRVREAVYAELDPATRAAIHGSLARALEARHAGAELLFQHFVAADERGPALRYGEIAAEAAGRALAFDRAAEIYRSTLPLVADGATRRRLLAALGDRLVDAGRSKEAAECFLEAAESGEPDRQAHLDLMRRAAERFLMSGHIKEGLDATEVVLGAAGLTLPSTQIGAIARLGWYQFRLSRRELAWPARRAAEVEPSAATRMDLCWSVGAGLGLVDSIRSAVLISRGALECLDRGDDARIARAFAAAAIAHAGLLQRDGAARVGEACRRAADADGSDASRFYAALVTMAERFFLANDWPATIATAREAAQLWRSTGRTEGWEVDVIDQFTSWALDNGGRLNELAERVPAKVRAAQRAGNRFVEVNFRTQFVNLHLRADRADEARAEVEDAIAAWPRVGTGFGNQDYLALRGLTAIALYERDERAAEALLPRWRRYFGSLLSRVIFLRMDALWNVGAIALLRAAAAGARGETSQLRTHLTEATRARDEVNRIASPYAHADAMQIEVGIASLRGDRAGMERVLREAIADADARGAELHATAMRARLGALVGGDQGASLAQRAAAWMREQSVRDPDRLVGTVLPASDASPRGG